MKYIKSIKLIGLVSFIVLGTVFCIRKVDPLKQNVEDFIRAGLPVNKNYQYINIGKKQPVTQNIDLKHLISKADGEIINKKIKKTFTHRYRLNDTLYSVQMYASDKDSIIAINHPVKILF
jgi:hypothetical protein